MWVRGLKPVCTYFIVMDCSVAPHVGAWIETQTEVWLHHQHQSHPMWVRGLKQKREEIQRREREVAPHVGAWIETITKVNRMARTQVAPHVGAWIETPISGFALDAFTSRTPCGCVD